MIYSSKVISKQYMSTKMEHKNTNWIINVPFIIWRLYKIKINLKLLKQQNQNKTKLEMQLYLVEAGFI